jgi:phosphoglycerate dehydrogenase-like enzyme
MKIAFLGTHNDFTASLHRELVLKFPEHECLMWNEGEVAPANDLELLLVNGTVTREQFVDQPKLSFIQTVSTGYEALDIEAATQLGIWVSYAPSDATGNATSVAEFAVLLLLGASRHLAEDLDSVLRGSAPVHRPSPALFGKTACIIGLGSIGLRVAERLRGFGVRIIGTDEHPERAPNYIESHPADQLKTAVGEADFVVICVRASKENENLIDESILRAMKRGVVLVNVARGSLIDEEALYTALVEGQVSATGMDVLRDEPVDRANRLLTLPQVLITPHVAAFTDIMLRGTAAFVTKVIKEVAEGSKPESTLNAPQSPRLRLKTQ